MIRLTWMQSRLSALLAVAGLVAVAIVLGATGPHLVHLYDSTVVGCGAHGDCSTATSDFLKDDRGLQVGLDALIVVVPGILGLFWGAPLVARELETGTWRLAWTQSVTRTRWLAVKLGLVGVASMAVAGLLSLMVTWWSSPVDRANMAPYGSFDQRDLVPIGYAALAFALGVAAGVLLRRTVPAMATTLVTFVAARLVVDHWVRPHLIAPLHRAIPLDAGTVGFGSTNGGPFTLQSNPPDIPNAWVTSTQIVDRAGHVIPPQLVAKACPGLSVGGPGGPVATAHRAAVPAPAGVQNALQGCVAKLSASYHEVVAYQPGSRYWTLQWCELGICIAAALALAGFCVWWVRRRLA